MSESRLNYLRRRMIRIVRILQSPYRKLILDERLNFKSNCLDERLKNFRSNCLPFPKFEKIFEDSRWSVFKINGFQFFWPNEYDSKDLIGLYHEIFTPPPLNPHAYEIGDLKIQPGDWVVDAGDCEGFFTYLALQRGAHVLVVEPVPKLAEALTHTFESEIRMGRVILLQGGLGEKPGYMSLEIPADKVYCAQISPEGSEIIEIYTLDNLIEDQIVPSIDFIKMDIEDHEVAAFKGAKKSLNLCQPKLSIAVYHSLHNARDIRSIVLEAQPAYRVRWRGLLLKEGKGPARPYLLHAAV